MKYIYSIVCLLVICALLLFYCIYTPINSREAEARNVYMKTMKRELNLPLLFKKNKSQFTDVKTIYNGHVLIINFYLDSFNGFPIELDKYLSKNKFENKIKVVVMIGKSGNRANNRVVFENTYK